MKRILFALLLQPQMIFAQYNAKCFSLDTTTDTKQVTLRQVITKDTEIPFSVEIPISGMSVSGRVVFDNDDESYVRVVMKDDYNYDYLLYENYPLLADGMSVDFQNIAIETQQLDGINPKSIRVDLMNATLTLESLCYVGSSGKVFKNKTILQKAQNQHVVERLNRNLIKNNKTWRAGMTSVADMTYEEKKALFGGELPQLYGFEYYVGGIFVMPGALNSVGSAKARSITLSSYVSTWDWRNRHGKNWMTCVKNQGVCNSCWAHAAVGVVESYVNLYYNRLINPNLSEQEVIAFTGFGCNPGYESVALNYIKDEGIVNEQCFPYYIPDSVNCSARCDEPDTLVSINAYRFVTKTANYTDSIKRALFKNPLTIAIGPWGHSMVLAGYKEIEMGDKIYLGNQSGAHSITINDDYANYVGKTAWLVKNSWGQLWGDNGYGYVIVNDSNIWRVLTPIGDITCNILNNNDISCEDADGDGYYFWGTAPKPLSWPIWIPDSIDGNDNDPQKGKLYLESPHVIGELETINPTGISTITINSNTTYTTRQYKRSHIVVASNKMLTVKNILNMFGRPTISVQSGGQLIIDGGVITNAYFNLAAGSILVLKNGGKIVMRTNTDFYAPVGALIDITHGEILHFNNL